jgi:hypothetical protein
VVVIQTFQGLVYIWDCSNVLLDAKGHALWPLTVSEVHVAQCSASAVGDHAKFIRLENRRAKHHFVPVSRPRCACGAVLTATHRLDFFLSKPKTQHAAYLRFQVII